MEWQTTNGRRTVVTTVTAAARLRSLGKVSTGSCWTMHPEGAHRGKGKIMTLGDKKRNEAVERVEDVTTTSGQSLVDPESGELRGPNFASKDVLEPDAEGGSPATELEDPDFASKAVLHSGAGGANELETLNYSSKDVLDNPER